MTRIFNFIYCLGAAIVILGAMGKLMHYSWSDVVLQIALITEAGIFVLLGFQELSQKTQSGVPQIKMPEGHVGDSWELNESINNLNNTIKKVFNQ